MISTTKRPALYNVLARIGITIAALALFLVLRPDVARSLQHEYTSRLRLLESGPLISNYIRITPVRKLQIGAGLKDKPGWLNTDIEPGAGEAFLDASKPFPLPDKTFKYVYSEQVIEHISYEEGMIMLKESYRILEPGGRVRLATPNLDKFLELFQEKKTEAMINFMARKMQWSAWPPSPDPECYMLNEQMHDFGHRFLYTPKMLRASLEAAGFRSIRQFQPGESDDPSLKNMEDRAHWGVADVNAYEAMNFEAVRE